MRLVLETRWSPAATVVSVTAIVTLALEQGSGWSDEMAEPPLPVATQAIALDDLPPPPAEIESLIEAADVSFRTGPRPAAEAQIAQPRQVPSDLARGPKFEAETTYTLSYRFTSHCRWHLSSTSDASGQRFRQLIIHVRYRDIELDSSHVVWFRKPPERDQFWKSPLVRHEFDHVRLSSDPILAKRLKEKLAQSSVLRLRVVDSPTESEQLAPEQLAPEQSASSGNDQADPTARPDEIVRIRDISDVFVREYVDRHVAEVFQQIASLVEIRYRELDRVTRHGQSEVPENSVLAAWLGR